MGTRRIYICSPCSTEEQIAVRRQRIEELSERIRRMGWKPVYNGTEMTLGKRLNDVTMCHGIVLDVGWKKCSVCIDEYTIANNHKLTFFHTREEWDSVSGKFVL